MKLYLKFVFILFILLGGCQSDLYTKQLATESLRDRPAVSLVSGYLDLRYTENEGIAFSFFEAVTPAVRKPLLASLQLFSSLVVCALIVIWRRKPFFVLLPLVLVVSGAFGNVMDRLRFGYVVDFIHFHVQDHFSWPIFNVADILISAGMVLLILQMLLHKETPFGPIKRVPAVE